MTFTSLIAMIKSIKDPVIKFVQGNMIECGKYPYTGSIFKFSFDSTANYNNVTFETAQHNDRTLSYLEARYKLKFNLDYVNSAEIKNIDIEFPLDNNYQKLNNVRNSIVTRAINLDGENLSLNANFHFNENITFNKSHRIEVYETLKDWDRRLDYEDDRVTYGYIKIIISLYWAKFEKNFDFTVYAKFESGGKMIINEKLTNIKRVI